MRLLIGLLSGLHCRFNCRIHEYTYDETSETLLETGPPEVLNHDSCQCDAVNELLSSVFTKSYDVVHTMACIRASTMALYVTIQV